MSLVGFGMGARFLSQRGAESERPRAVPGRASGAPTEHSVCSPALCLGQAGAVLQSCSIVAFPLMCRAEQQRERPDSAACLCSEELGR